MLYLHEYVDIVGEGAVPYMEHTLRFDTERAAGGSLTLVGTWQVVGVTGRWPQVVNLWEIAGGWDGWGALVDAANVRRAANRPLEGWWREAYRFRSGGFDRLLRGAPGCPTLAELATGGVRGSLFVHELSTVRPGAGPDYLAAAAEEWAPVAADHAHHPVGLYEVLLGDTEVVTVWATTLDGHLALTAGDDDRVPKWRARAREFLTRWREELMVPVPGSALAVSGRRSEGPPT
jgi:hypothetical protein